MVDRQNLPRPAPEVIDDEPDMLGEADVGLEVTLSGEEAAMRVVDDPGGLNYDPDPGYVDRSLDSEPVDHEENA